MKISWKFRLANSFRWNYHENEWQQQNGGVRAREWANLHVDELEILFILTPNLTSPRAVVWSTMRLESLNHLDSRAIALHSRATTKHALKSMRSEQWRKYLLKFVQWLLVGVGCLHSKLSSARAKFNPIYAFINIYENCLISHKSFSLEAAISYNGELENISPSTWKVFFA